MFVSPDEKVIEAIAKMKDKSLTQLPVMENNKIIGSISESAVLNLLLENVNVREQEVKSVMGKPFPHVGWNSTSNEISKLITRENSAVLVEKPTGEMAIITEFDLIEAMA